MTRIPKKTQPAVQEWSSYWYHIFKAKHCRPPDGKTVLILAAICARSGPPETEKGRETYYALSQLLANPGQRSRLTQVVTLLAENIDQVPRIVNCVKAYNKFIVPNNGKVFDSGRYKLDRVVKTMFQIPDAEAYVKSLVQSPLRTPNAVFHPRTLENKRSVLKGVFGYDAGDHDDQLKRKVRVIE